MIVEGWTDGEIKTPQGQQGSRGRPGCYCMAPEPNGTVHVRLRDPVGQIASVGWLVPWFSHQGHQGHCQRGHRTLKRVICNNTFQFYVLSIPPPTMANETVGPPPATEDSDSAVVSDPRKAKNGLHHHLGVSLAFFLAPY